MYTGIQQSIPLCAAECINRALNLTHGKGIRNISGSIYWSCTVWSILEGWFML